MRVSALSLLFAASTFGCGGTSKDSDAGDGGKPSGGSGTSSGGASSKGGSASSGGRPTAGGSTSSGGASSAGAAGTASSCPGSPPTNGGVCEPPGASGSGFESARAHCSWGDDPRPQCRTTAVCSAPGAWSVADPGSECSEPALPAACPVTPATPGSECAEVGLLCWYDDGTACQCSPCVGGSEYPVCQIADPPEWACSKSADGCPNPLPQAGASCSQPGLDCGHSCELTIRCEGGTWQWGGGNCPRCAAPDTPIATPAGDRAIAELRVGDVVYSVDQGAIVPVRIARVSSTPAVNHRVMRVQLEGGAVLEMSPGHPTADGRPLSALLKGGQLDEQHAVISAELVPYAHAHTYDILPDSSTGTYFAAGALVGSTLGGSTRRTLSYRLPEPAHRAGRDR